MSPLAKIRRKKGISLEVLGKALSLSPSSVSRMERGLLPVSAETAEAISKLPLFEGEITELEILYPDRFVDVAA